ncbi:MAG: DUF3570 domain-containing protein [Labilithrix sp.]|nr:DUF3570 domain-containing protein [Labilithrix sp.]MCW5811333.1 DUF3570 domain-containing protein [Labilithrix sp.]
MRKLWALRVFLLVLGLVVSRRASAARGWDNPDALALAKEGIDAKKAGDIEKCIAKDSESLNLEDHPYVRLHISSCYAAQKKYKDALINARTALQAALQDDDDELKEASLKRVNDLLPRLAKLKVELPAKSDGLKITLNGKPVKPAQLAEKVTLDPGEYKLEVKSESGKKASFKSTITLDEGDEKTVEVKLKTESGEPDGPPAPPKAPRAVIARASLLMSGYTDTANVHLATPSVTFNVAAPDNEWRAGGGYLVDLITAASPDMVSSASRRFREVRHQASGNGAYKFAFGRVGALGYFSTEPDYRSISFGATYDTETSDGMIMPQVGYRVGLNTLGYRDTPFENFSKSLTTHTLDGGATFIVAPDMLVVATLTLMYEAGEQAKLYRFVPMFTEDVAARVQPGLSPDAVNFNRIDLRPRENLPQQRLRVAANGRLNYKVSPSGTVRLEERLYNDNWGISASTTDGVYLIDLSDRIRVWPHGRFHAQTGASFHQLAYVAAGGTGDAAIIVPQFRTTDRELAPMIGLTGGGGVRLTLTTPGSFPMLGVVVSADVMYNKYLESLYITGRTALWGTVGVEGEF